MILFKNLKKYKNLIHGILERKEGSVNPFSNFESGENILKAVRKLGWKSAKIDNLIFAEQIHNKNVFFCPPDIGGYIKLGVDGLITKNRGQILIVKTADCIPLLIYDSKEKKIGAIHAGREGLIKGIIENTIKIFNSDPSYFVVAIGPHIRECCYFLKGKNKNYSRHPEWKKYIQKKNKRFYFNLTKIVIDKLFKAGVRKENIEDCGICSYCQAEKFYSARRKEKQQNIYKKENERFPETGSFIGLI